MYHREQYYVICTCLQIPLQITIHLKVQYNVHHYFNYFDKLLLLTKINLLYWFD